MRMKTEDWDAVLTANLRSAFLLSRTVSRIMLKQRSGCILNMSSVVGLHGNGGQANYAASKAGLIGLTKSLAKELSSRNIRVNAIAPGYIETSMTSVLPETARESLKAAIPLQRARNAGRCGRSCPLPLQRQGIIYYRRCIECRRRHGDVIMSKRRVVVTGFGVVCPLGNDVPTFWSNIKANKSGIGPITIIDSSDLAVKIAGEVKGFNPALRIDQKIPRKWTRFAQFAVYAALEALESARLQKASLDPVRTGVCLGTGQGGSSTTEEAGVRLAGGALAASLP
jgi:hypothetical protein